MHYSAMWNMFTNFMEFLFYTLLSLSMIFFMLGNFLSKQNTDFISTPFECGFSSFKNTVKFLSSHFFIICLVFLVFDIEVLYLFPILLQFIPPIYGLWMFWLLVLGGLFLEWSQGGLEWLK